MRQAQTQMQVSTPGQGLIEITDDIVRWVADQGIVTGLLTVFVRHSSASLTIQENADPDVAHDLQVFFKGLVAEDHEDEGLYTHCNEGPDDMPGHIKSALTDTTLTIPISDARPVLGTWQGIFLFEHRTGQRDRQVVLHVLGEG